MNIPYIIFVVVTCSIATLTVSQKNLALPYVFALAFLPASVNIIVGTVNIWGTDILSLVILLLIVSRGGFAPPFRLCWMDYMIPIMCLFRVISLLTHGNGPGDAAQQFMRWILPWFLPYIIARIGCSTWDGFKRIVSVMILSAIIAAFFIIYESITGENILRMIGLSKNPTGMKWGFWRSRGPFGSIHIAGMYVGMMGILALSLFIASSGKKAHYFPIFILLAVASYLSTAATGVMLLTSGLLFLLLYQVRSAWKVWFYGFLLFNFLANFVVDKGVHYFYARRLQVMGTAYYRARLIDKVLDLMISKNLLIGLGDRIVLVAGQYSEDLCNEWLFILVKTGLIGFSCFVALYIGALFRLKECYELLYDFKGERFFFWGILSSLVALAAGFMFIALFGSDLTLFTFFLGLVVSMPELARRSLRLRSGAPA